MEMLEDEHPHSGKIAMPVVQNAINRDERTRAAAALAKNSLAVWKKSSVQALTGGEP
jgi:Tfp pilus assembly protein PilE